MVTIKMIAQRCGLSTAAVSRALNHLPGISAENAESYLSYNRIIACGGSWMVPAAALSAGDFDTVERLTRAAVQKIEEVRV